MVADADARLGSTLPRSAVPPLPAAPLLQRSMVSSRETMPPPTSFDSVAAASGAPAGRGGRTLAPDLCLGPYRVMRRLGAGGMGEVWLARDEQLGRRVALKVLRDTTAHLGELLLREARTTAHFSHPNIVQIYATGLYEGRPWLALELIDGGSLRDRLQAGPLSGREGARLLKGVADALVLAHQAGVVHQDLKPENILVGTDGRARVADFGLAQQVALQLTDAQADTLASLGMGAPELRGPCGTPPYMAPEQFRGEVPTPATDVWSFGVLLWETLRGDRPFDDEASSVPSLAARVLGLENAPAIDDVPPALARLVRGCLDPQPERRPDAQTVAAGLAQFLEPGQTEEDGPPFRGLSSYTEDAAAAFHGREPEVQLLVEQLRDQPLLALIGPSGTGKSSLALGGIIPRLREQGPVCLVRTRPGRDPFGALARVLQQRSTAPGRAEDPAATRGDPEDRASPAALRADPFLLGRLLRRQARHRNQTVVLFVDQLEEVLSSTDAQTHRAYLRCICLASDDPADPVRVVLTLRDDFLGRLALDTDIRRALSRVSVVHPPGPAGLTRILEAPVAARGFAWETPDMVAELVAATDGLVASLPLLQVAGALLWERRDPDQRIIPAAALDDIGGLQGALARHADGVLAGLSPVEEDWVRRLVLRLVTPGETRAVARLEDLEQALGAACTETLERLAAHRLVTVRRADGGTTEVELVHEALISHWDRLRRWLDEGRADHRLAQDLEEAALVWERQGTPPEGCLRGLQLEEALQARDLRGLVLSPRADRFVTAGVDATAARKRHRQRLRFGVALVVLVVLGSLAGTLRQREARIEAQEKLMVSEQRSVDALSRERDGARASLLAMKAQKDRAEAKTSSALVRAVAGLWLAQRAQDDPATERIWETLLLSRTQGAGLLHLPPPSPDHPLAYVALHPDHRRVITGWKHKSGFSVIDLETGETLQQTPGCAPKRLGGAWSADGARFALICDESDETEVYDAEGTLQDRLSCPIGAAESTGQSHVLAWMGSDLVLGGEGGLCVFRGPKLALSASLPTDKPLRSLAVSDRWIAASANSASGEEAGTWVWDRTTLQSVLSLPGNSSSLSQLLLTDEVLLRRFRGPPAKLELWSLQGTPTKTLDIEQTASWDGDAALGAAGDTLLVPWQGNVERWAGPSATEDEAFQMPSAGRSAPIVSPDGRFVVDPGWSGRLRVADARLGTILFEDFTATTRLRPVGFLDDHRLLLWTTYEGLFVWDLSSLPDTGIAADPRPGSLRLAGDRAWWVGRQGALQTATSQAPEPETFAPKAAEGAVRIVGASDDWALSLRAGTVESWRPGTAEPEWSQPGPKDLIDATVSPDGTLVALRTAQGEFRVLDRDGQTQLRLQAVADEEITVGGVNFGRANPTLAGASWTPDSSAVFLESHQSGERWRCVRADWRCSLWPRTIRQAYPTPSPDGQLLFDRHIDNKTEAYTVRRLDPTTAEPLWTWDNPVSSLSIPQLRATNRSVVAYTRSGLLLTVSADGSTHTVNHVNADGLSGIEVTEDQTRVLLTNNARQNGLRVWSLANPRLVWAAETTPERAWRYHVSKAGSAVQAWAVVQDRLLIPLSPAEDRDPEAAAQQALEQTNLRVCPETLEVVSVVPFPDASSPWAPKTLCTAAAP